jgi:hypothetical protein
LKQCFQSICRIFFQASYATGAESIDQGLSNCGSSIVMPATVYRYAALIKDRNIKKDNDIKK